MTNLKEHPTIQNYIAYNHFGRLLGMDFTLESVGTVVYRMKVDEIHLATPRAAHGGTIATLMDAALGVAALGAVCEAGKVVSTVEMSIHFLAPALLNDELTGTAEIISQGNRLLVAEGKIKNQEGKIIASGSGTFNAYPKEKAGL